MKVLLIGGTGVLSFDIAKYIIDRDDIEVYLLNRGTRKNFIPLEAHFIRADIRNVEDTKEKIQKMYFDTIIDFLSYNLGQLKNTLKIVEGHYIQYLFISSATVYNNRLSNNNMITETSSIGNKTWSYVNNKIQCESYLKDYFKESAGTYYTIVRPYVTYNKTRIPFAVIPYGYYQWTLISRILSDKPILIWDNGKTTCPLTNAIDFAKGISGLLGNKKAYNNIFHITSSDIVKWEDVILLLGKILNKDVKLVRIPSDFIGKYLPEYRDILFDDKALNYSFDNKKIINIVPEMKSCISLKDGLKTTVEFYLNNTKVQLFDYKWEGKIDATIEKYIKKYDPNSKNIIKYLNINMKKNTSIKNKIKYFLCRNIYTYKMIKYIKKNII